MSSPVRLDLVIFGASGFTGKRVVKELTRIGRNYPDITWAVAGRNRIKLETVLHEVSKKTGEDLSNTKIIIADAEDKISIKNMCGQAKVLVNCTGPCAKFGEVVVSAAVDCKTHYVDSTVETQFIDLIKEKYDQPAREAGVYIINACGFCSIPADLGVIYLEQNFGGTVNSVDAYVTCKFAPKMHAEAKRNGMIKYSTWESSIISMATIPLKKLLQSLRPSFELVPELKHWSPLHRRLNKWCLPLPGSDNYIVRRTQRLLLSLDDKRPVKYKPYIMSPSTFITIQLIVASLLCYFLIKISFTRHLILKYPKLCTFGLVTYDYSNEDVMDDCLFQYEMVGHGWDKGTDLKKTPDKKMIAKISVAFLKRVGIACWFAAAFRESRRLVVHDPNRPDNVMENSSPTVEDIVNCKPPPMPAPGISQPPPMLASIHQSPHSQQVQQLQTVPKVNSQKYK